MKLSPGDRVVAEVEICNKRGVILRPGNVMKLFGWERWLVLGEMRVASSWEADELARRFRELGLVVTTHARSPAQ